MRIVILSDIMSVDSVWGKIKRERAREHGGDRTEEEQREYAEIWRNLGYDVVSYTKGFKISPEDIIFFGDRAHFYDGWKYLKKNKLLRNAICSMIESPVVDRQCGKKMLTKVKKAFPIFLTYQDDIIDQSKFFKQWPAIRVVSTMNKSTVPWEERGLAAIVCTNQLHMAEDGELYTERKRIVEYFEEHGEYEFGVFGRGWEGYRNWRGAVESKTEIYNNFKFAICLENTRVNGYVTEKIFDCLNQGIVPVYGGAYNIASYVPKECFIDYFQFKNLDEMAAYLAGIDQEIYGRYLESIEKFLKSEAYSKFGVRGSVENLHEAIKHLPEKFSPGIAGSLSMLYYVQYRGSVTGMLQKWYEQIYDRVSKHRIMIGMLRKLRMFCLKCIHHC